MLHEMHVEISRPKLLAARRLHQAVAQRESTQAASTPIAAPIDYPVVGAVSAQSAQPELGGSLIGDGSAEGEEVAAEAPPPEPELTGMGDLPFMWYEGCVADVEFFGKDSLQTDDVASSPDVSSHLLALLAAPTYYLCKKQNTAVSNP